MAEPSSIRILVVDDHQDNIDILTRQLERRGFLTTSAKSGTEALQVLMTGGIDLVMLDIVMPGIDGLDVLMEIRKRYPKSAIPVIMCTSKSESDDVVMALNLGANDYVTKPLNMPVTLARIQTQLAQKREYEKIKTQSTYSLHEGEAFGPYTLVSKVGEGGMGMVYKVHDPALDRFLALKILHPNASFNHRHIERFIREAKIIAKIRHPNIVHVYDIGQRPYRYIVMDYIDGRDLALQLQDGPLSAKLALQIAKKLASALALSHQQDIIHRDLKPSNIMIDHQFEPHLMDFGIAKIATNQDRITKTGELIGTPDYMAPEQIDNTLGCVDRRSDLYSLGILLYEMLTARVPFEGSPIQLIYQILHNDPKPPSEHISRLSPEMDAFCLRAIARNPTQRPQDAAMFIQEIESISQLTID